MTLDAFRYHGTGLFPNDYIADYVGTADPVLHKLIYWLSTFFADPLIVTQALPFLCLSIVVWQGFSLGRAYGGVVLGCATVILLLHCTLLWDRMVGGNARAFGYPLVIAFLRYAALGKHRATLAVLLSTVLLYPSAFFFCAPAYGLTLLVAYARDTRRPRAQLYGYLGTCVAACAILLATVWFADPRFGHPPTLAEAATLRQMGRGGEQPFYPPRHIEAHIKAEAKRMFSATGGQAIGGFQKWNKQHAQILGWALIPLFATFAGRRLRALPAIIPALLVASLFAFGVARVLAYRLYLPERMLTYAWAPLLVLSQPMLGALALSRFGRRRAGAIAGVAVVLFAFLGQGDGLARDYGIHNWTDNDDKTIQFIGTLPKDTLLAAHPRVSTFIQCYARRRVLFSAITNIVNFYQYGVEMEQRLEEYYRAYYAADIDTVLHFAHTRAVDYLVVDERDFGPGARERSVFAEPWNTINADLIAKTPPERMALAHVPEKAVVFRDGPVIVVSTKRLAELPREP